MLSPVLLLAILISCKKEVRDLSGTEDTSSAINAAPMATTTAPAHMLYRETFEDGSPFTDANTQFTEPYSFAVATKPVFEASKSGRFELRDGDPLSNGGTRAEVSFPKPSSFTNRWYSFAVYFPAADFKYDVGDELISQWHQHQGNASSAISLRIKEDRYRLTVIPGLGNQSEKIDLGTVAKDQWNTFVVHIKHSPNSDGLIELWLNGKKIVNRSGVNAYSLSSASGMIPPYWKLGVYKSNWNGSQTTGTTKRVLYYDDIRMGDQDATLADMTPGGSVIDPTPKPIPEPTPTPGPTTGTATFTLVSAHTEKDIMTITNGSTISLSKFDVPKLNIRANMNSSTLGSVKFELSGAQSLTVVDNQLPYALQGDNGAGNYYYGTWNPPALGTYKLKVTPYSGAKATGTAGTPSTISFTFVK